MTTVFNQGSLGGRVARASALCLLALAAMLFQAREARAQWTQPDTQGNISSTNTGNVGVGTSSPAHPLTVASNTNVTPMLVTGTNPNVVGFVVNNSNAGSKAWGLQVAGSGNLSGVANGSFIVRQATDNLNALIFSPGGNVGIGTPAPAFLLDVSGSTSTPFRVRDSAGREYLSTTIRTGTYGTATVVSLGGSRLIVDGSGPDGNNDTIVRRMVNSMVIYPSDHPNYPGAFMVRQVSGYAGLFVDQRTNGNVGVGTTAPAAKLHVAGDIRVDGNISAKYQDVAEWVPSKQKLQAGTVVVLDTAELNHVQASARAYDTGVAGVISAQPGIALGEAGEGKALVATTGRVKVKVDATRAPIKIGDLLVTSDVGGVAMKSEPMAMGSRKFHSPGTIIGKALEPLAGGTGEILVLLSLQ